jgi:hypothetical protein
MWGIWEEFEDNTSYSCPMCSTKFKVRWEKAENEFLLLEQHKERRMEPLGLPKGSVRASVILLLSLACWIMIILERTVPVYLLNLILIALGYHFAQRNLFSRFNPSVAVLAEGEEHPLNLPEGWVRGLVVAGFTVSALFLIWKGTIQDTAFAEFFIIMFGIIIGHIILKITVDHQDGGWYTVMGHLKAAAVILLTVTLFLLLVSGEYEQSNTSWIRFMIASIGFYFGSR